MNNTTLSIIAAASIAFASTALAGEVIARYDAAAGFLPTEACWVALGPGFSPSPTIVDDALHFGPTGYSTPSFFLNELPVISFADGASIEGSVKVEVSTYYENFPYRRSGYCFALYDHTGAYALLGISDDRLLLQTQPQENWDDQTFLFDTTSGFHVYRLEIVGTTATVLIDGIVVLSDSVGMTQNANRAWFGDASTVGTSTTATQWVQVEGTPPCCKADITGDGIVNGADLAAVLAAWGSLNCNADLNLDLTVNAEDLGILLSAWGRLASS